MTQTDAKTDDQVQDQTQQTAVDEEKTQDVETGDAVDTNLDSEQVDYKSKFSESAKEAIRLTKENETNSSKLELQDKMIEVAKDQQQIHEIAKHNPIMADAICKEYGWGDTYSSAMSSAGHSTGDDKVADTIDPKQAAREVYQEQKQVEEQKAVSDYEVQFFIDNKIAIGSPKYKAIMSTYSKFSPKTLADSKEMFGMAHKQHAPGEEVDIPAPNGDLGGSGRVSDSEFTNDDKKMMKTRGWDEKKMRAFKSSHLYQ